MEMFTASLSYPFSMLLPLVSTLVAGAFLLYHSSTTRRSGPNLPQGSKWHWPFVGETLRFISAYRSENPERFTDELVRRNGRIFTIHLFGEPVLFSVDPEFNQFVLNGEGRYFDLDYFPTLPPLLGHKALINMKEPLHQRMYTFTSTRFGSLSVLRNSLLPEIDRVVRDTVDSWQDGQKVTMVETAGKLGFDICMKQLMSKDPSKWTETLRTELIHTIGGLVSIPLPSLLAFSFTTFGKAVQARTKMAEKLRIAVRKRREERKEMATDVLDDLMMMEDGLDEEGIVDSLVSLLAGAFENPAKLLTLTVKVLTENPHVLSHLREEHEQIMRAKKNHDDPLEWKDYEAMSFTQCVINETLRTGNIVTTLHRRATTEINYKGFTIPKGFKVCPWIRAVHLDPENFKDARTFDPWRWQTTNSNNSSIFTPVGGGPRLCPGYKLGRLLISVFLHYFVTRLDWSVAEKDRLVFFPIVGPTKGYPIFVRRRSVQDGRD